MFFELCKHIANVRILIKGKNMFISTIFYGLIQKRLFCKILSYSDVQFAAVLYICFRKIYHIPESGFLIKTFNNLTNNNDEMFIKNPFDLCRNNRICFKPEL